jgi:hypothetical protein
MIQQCNGFDLFEMSFKASLQMEAVETLIKAVEKKPSK